MLWAEMCANTSSLHVTAPQWERWAAMHGLVQGGALPPELHEACAQSLPGLPTMLKEELYPVYNKHCACKVAPCSPTLHSTRVDTPHTEAMCTV